MTGINKSLLLRIDDVVNEVKLGESTIKHLVKKGQFPRPIKIGIRAIAWKRADINLWIESLSNSPASGGEWNA